MVKFYLLEVDLLGTWNLQLVTKEFSFQRISSIAISAPVFPL